MKKKPCFAKRSRLCHWSDLIFICQILLQCFICFNTFIKILPIKRNQDKPRLELKYLTKNIYLCDRCSKEWLLVQSYLCSHLRCSWFYKRPSLTHQQCVSCLALFIAYKIQITSSKSSKIPYIIFLINLPNGLYIPRISISLSWNWGVFDGKSAYRQRRK